MDEKVVFLIADDDPDDQFLIRNAFQASCDHEIETKFVWDGVELMEALEEDVRTSIKMPEMIMLDLNMPRKDGRNTLKNIKTDPRFKAIPVAVLTNSNDPTDIQFCSDYGAIGCFQKPNTTSELNLIIKCLCEYVFHKLSNPKTGTSQL